MMLQEGEDDPQVSPRPDKVETETILDGIRRWVEIETPTTDAEAVNRLVDMVEASYRAHGLAVERIAGRDGFGDHLLARTPWGGSEDGILVLSHLDTVHPIGMLDRLPFRVEGDRAYGPGIYDMKGGAYLAFDALTRRAEQGRSTPLPVTHLLVSDEELGSVTSRPLIEREAQRARYVLVTEPARDGGKVVTARKGVARFTLRVKGRPAHAGARHDEGRSAIRELAHQILRLEAMTDPARGITVNVGVVAGGTRENVVPEEALAKVDVRVPSIDSAEEMTRRVLGLTPVGEGVRLEVSGGLNRPPFQKDERVAALLAQARRIAQDPGFTLEDVATGGGSDGNFAAPFAATLDGLGVDGDGAHTHWEHLLVSSILPRRALLDGLFGSLA